MLLFLTRLLRVLVALFLVRLVMQALGGLFRARRANATPARPPRPEVSAGDLVRDRVCNTFLPREHALSDTIAGRQEHFCSPGCRDRARAAVARSA
jgi:hypothetical protein